CRRAGIFSDTCTHEQERRMDLGPPELGEVVARIQDPPPKRCYAIAVSYARLEALRDQIAVPFDTQESASYRQTLRTGEQLPDTRFLGVDVGWTEQCLVTVLVVIECDLKLPVEAERMIKRSVRARTVRRDGPARAADQVALFVILRMVERLHPLDVRTERERVASTFGPARIIFGRQHGILEIDLQDICGRGQRRIEDVVGGDRQLVRRALALLRDPDSADDPSRAERCERRRRDIVI